MSENQRDWLKQLKAGFDAGQIADPVLSRLFSDDIARMFPEVFHPGIVARLAA